MVSLRGGSGSQIEQPLLLVGCILLAVVVLGFLHQQLRRRRRTRYHEPLQMDSEGVLGQINRRKEDLSRYISRLHAQLAVREKQLRYHDELEGVVTARVETSRRQDKEWRELMKAGKKIHGKKWSTSGADGASLRELMEQHKHDLLEFKRNRTMNTPCATPRVAQLPSARSTAPAATVAASADTRSKIVPEQWQSTRQTASAQTPHSVRLPTESPPKPTAVAVAEANEPRVSMIVPRLDLSRLPAAPMVSLDPTDEPQQQPPAKKQSFAMAFARQAKLAKSLKKKKK